MKFVILDNTAWTTHFVVLQSISRAAETASAASRRTSKRLVRWTPPTSPLLPFIPIRSSGRVRWHAARTVTNFFRSPLRTYPYDERGNMTRTQRIPANPSVRDARRGAYCRCTIVVRAVTFGLSQKRRRPRFAGVVRHQMGI